MQKVVAYSFPTVLVDPIADDDLTAVIANRGAPYTPILEPDEYVYAILSEDEFFSDTAVDYETVKVTGIVADGGNWEITIERDVESTDGAKAWPAGTFVMFGDTAIGQRELIEGLGDHVDNTTTAHGAVSAATASKIIIRDSDGRAKIADPSASDDIASKGYVDELPLHGFRNKIINGNFDIWQRGTSDAASATYRYLADRWRTFCTTSTIAMSRQAFTVGQTDVSNEPAYFWRGVVVSSAGASNNAIGAQYIESVRTLAGKKATLTFWAKANANKNMSIEFGQHFGTGGSPSSTVNTIGVLKVALTTSWQKFTHTVDIPSIAGKTLGTTDDGALRVFFWFDAGSDWNTRTDSLGHQSGTFDIAQVQLEEGAVATPFEQRPIGVELSLCQRYYWNPCATYVAGATMGVGGCRSATEAMAYIKFPVTMRVNPTITVSNVGHFIWKIMAGLGYTHTSHIYVVPHVEGYLIYGVVASGLTANTPAFLEMYNSSAKMHIDAEL